MIPSWNISAVIPPIRPGDPGHSVDRSPYNATISEVIERFATSPERCRILRGLLDYRGALDACGVSSGFQWLDGSFMEHKEAILREPPKDVDVVTFFHLPAGASQASFLETNAALFDVDATKTRFCVDGYLQLLGSPLTPPDVRQIAYWHSMWSHCRNGLWKGFVQVDISRFQDDVASRLLDQIKLEAES